MIKFVIDNIDQLNCIWLFTNKIFFFFFVSGKFLSYLVERYLYVSILNICWFYWLETVSEIWVWGLFIPPPLQLEFKLLQFLFPQELLISEFSRWIMICVPITHRSISANIPSDLLQNTLSKRPEYNCQNVNIATTMSMLVWRNISFICISLFL